MSVTKRDFENIARILKEQRTEASSPNNITLDRLIPEFCAYFKSQNVAFNPDRFKEAAGYKQ